MADEIKDDVFTILSIFSGVTKSKIKEKQVLSTDLHLDDDNLGFLTISLRGYIKKHRSSKTILVSEVRKGGLTVEDLVSLVKKRIQS
jgi:hypothetical protein